MSKPLPASTTDESAPPLIPPHANAEAHKRVMARLEAMTPEEFLASLARAGICTPNGELTEYYAGKDEEDAAKDAAE